jgi:hypothetical protein
VQNQQQAVQALTAWAQAVDASHAQLTAQAAPAPESTFLESVGEGVEDLVNGAASIGQAALDNPGAVVELAGGLAVAAGGYALATGGVVVSASGVGAIAGVPAVGLGWGMVGAGGLAAMDGARRLSEAASQNPVEPMQVNWGNEKKTKETNEKIDKHQRDSSNSHSRQQEDITQDPSHATPLFRQKAEQAEKKGWFW